MGAKQPKCSCSQQEKIEMGVVVTAKFEIMPRYHTLAACHRKFELDLVPVS